MTYLLVHLILGCQVSHQSLHHHPLISQNNTYSATVGSNDFKLSSNYMFAFTSPDNLNDYVGSSDCIFFQIALSGHRAILTVPPTIPQVLRVTTINDALTTQGHSKPPNIVRCTLFTCQTTIMLSVTHIDAPDNYGKYHKLRILLDTEYIANLISEECATLKRKPCSVPSEWRNRM